MSDASSNVPFFIRRVQQRISSSLFFVPAMLVSVAVVASQVTVQIDRSLEPGALPSYFNSTVASSRTILSSIAGGTITAASIVFSLTLVTVQLASSQFSPRVIRGLLADRFQQIVVGTVVGTFSYSLLLLRDVRQVEEEGAEPFLPQISIALALVLALLSLIAVLASIDHTAKSLRVGAIADRILEDSLDAIESLYPLPSDDDEAALSIEQPRTDTSEEPEGDGGRPPEHAQVILSAESGWLVDTKPDRLLELIPEGSSLLLPATVGSYVIEGTPLAFVWRNGGGSDDDEVIDGDELRDLVAVGPQRTVVRDLGFGITQLSDVALRALSPGVNDPNTAIEIIERMGVILFELHRRQLPGTTVSENDRQLIQPSQLTHRDFVDQAIEPIRRYGRTDPRVLVALVRMLVGIVGELDRSGTPIDLAALHRQIEIVDRDQEEMVTASDREVLRSVLERLSSNDS